MSLVLITGQQWVPQEYFDQSYAAKIRDAFVAGKNFCLGAAANGVDKMAQELLIECCILTGDDESFGRITIYDKGTNDGRLDKKFNLVNGFANYPARNTALALHCTEIICCLAQWGNGTSESLLTVITAFLKNNKDGIFAQPSDVKCVSLAHDIYCEIHAYSEPWNLDITNNEIVPLYKEYFS